VQQVAKAHESMAEYLQAPTGILSGRLRLGASKTILAYYLPAVLAEFKKRHPAVVCEVEEGNSDVIVGAMLERRIDLGLIEGPCKRPELQTRPFFSDEIVWLAAPSDPMAKKRSLNPEEILRRPLIAREIGCGTRRYMEMALRKHRLSSPRKQILQELISIEAIKRVIGSGLGIGYLSRLSVEQELASGTLVQLHCPALTIRRPFFILFPQGPDPMGVAHTFIQVLIEKAEA
jgi:DNA-binding transcriptional LysR family regulator